MVANAPVAASVLVTSDFKFRPTLEDFAMTPFQTCPRRAMFPFLCAIALAFIEGGSGLAAASPATGKIVEPRVLVDNKKIKMVRWILQPGEAIPPQTNALDHVEVVVRGADIREVTADGKTSEAIQETGRAVFIPSGHETLSIVNIGDAPYEMIWTDLKPQAGPATPNPPVINLLTLAKLVTQKSVPAQPIVDNEKIRMVRWIFQPGECSPIHIHALDHIYIVIHGSKIREITGEGKTNDDFQETGRAAFSPARGKIHSFANIGDARPYEMVSFELK
jgi:quercetin dioxygenase-like cupin family protein